METQNRYKLKMRKSKANYSYYFLDILQSSGAAAKLLHFAPFAQLKVPLTFESKNDKNAVINIR